MEGRSRHYRRFALTARVGLLVLLSSCGGAENGDAIRVPPPSIGVGAGGGSAGGGTADTIAPSVVATDPPDDAIGVAGDSAVRATFSEPMDAATLSNRSFTVSAADGSAVRGSVFYSGRTATFTPASELAPATAFTAALTTEVSDLAGNALPAAFVWSFTTAVDAWQPTPVTSATPIERTGHTAVWTGNEMIVWGGLTAIGPTASGGRLVPAFGTWSATATAGAPLARSDHTAVWTGTEMIVWGGVTATSVTRTGARYTPGVGGGSWVPTALANAPGARRKQTAVWTGREMIVWGGQDALQLLRSGARYNPATDTWTPISTANAPRARTGHTAVWTGKEMIVWGGRDALQPSLATGARYDPATDTWTAISTLDAPIGRFDHTAVWTGSEMIVWGGRTSTGFTQTGGRYDPVTDSWSPISTQDAPLARADHTAVWTGTEMIIWGGQDLGILNSGGRYRATFDRWRVVSQENAPTVRFDHSAVWTGAEMIVWGGTPGFLVNTAGSGGRYTP